MLEEYWVEPKKGQAVGACEGAVLRRLHRLQTTAHYSERRGAAADWAACSPNLQSGRTNQTLASAKRKRDGS